jgi:hypothetical protein
LQVEVAVNFFLTAVLCSGKAWVARKVGADAIEPGHDLVGMRGVLQVNGFSGWISTNKSSRGSTYFELLSREQPLSELIF